MVRPVVRFGTSLEKLHRRMPDNAVRIRTSNPEFPPALDKSVPRSIHQYEAALDGLAPATTYYYAIFDKKGNRLTPADSSYTFTTNPVPGTKAPLHFWVVGDSGTGQRPQAMVHEAMIEHTKAIGDPIDLYVHVGDMAYRDGTNMEFSERFFKMYAPTLRNKTCWAAMGNHEGHRSNGKKNIGPFYDAYICPKKAEAGGVPSGNESYYSFDYGNIHFICLNSHDLDRKPSGAMAKWLKSDLEATKADFLIAFFHHPPYTMGSHNSDIEWRPTEMREHIMPILESGGVDLVFNGHSHIYERSMLIDGAYDTPTVTAGVVLDAGDGNSLGDGSYQKSRGLTPHGGTVAVVAGHGGAGVSRRGTMPVMKKISVENGSVLVKIEDDTIRVNMLNLHGDIHDTFSIVKRGVVEPAPVFLAPNKPTRLGPGKVQLAKVPAEVHQVIVPRGTTWRYFFKHHPTKSGGKPDLAWTLPSFSDWRWPQGPAGFGYGDGDDATDLEADLRGKKRVVYLRRKFTLPEYFDPKSLALEISYDDAFIAYLNGEEVARRGVDHEFGPIAEDYTAHEADGKFERIPLRDLTKILKRGEANTLAIEGHNISLDSSDFTLHPTLIELK